MSEGISYSYKYRDCCEGSEPIKKISKKKVVLKEIDDYIKELEKQLERAVKGELCNEFYGVDGAINVSKDFLKLLREVKNKLQ